jgi:DNA-binding NarL/FixJ family response regulator
MKHGLIVEDLPATRAWLAEVLGAAFPGIAVDSAGTCAEAAALVARGAYEVALVDLDLPDGSGVEVIGALRVRLPQAAAIVTTIFDDDAHVFPAMLAGAQGYLLKEQPREQFIAGLQGIVRGEPPLSPAIARRMIAHFNRIGPPAAAPGALTARETEVLRLVAKGYTQQEIAAHLGLSRHTVVDHVKSLYRKLDVSSRAEATLEAARRGLVR